MNFWFYSVQYARKENQQKNGQMLKHNIGKKELVFQANTLFCSSWGYPFGYSLLRFLETFIYLYILQVWPSHIEIKPMNL